MANATKLSVVSAAVLLLACGGTPPAVTADAVPAPPASGPSPNAGKEEWAPNEEETFTLLVSSSKEVFCDGARMDSAGYRKTLTKEQHVELPPNDGSLAGKAKAVAIAAGGLCSGAVKELSAAFVVRDGVVHVPPIPRWAGAGIAMCTCVPEIEANLLRLPGITKVVWEGPTS